jgi:hypothetical protein
VEQQCSLFYTGGIYRLAGHTPRTGVGHARESQPKLDGGRELSPSVTSFACARSGSLPERNAMQHRFHMKEPINQEAG